MRQRGGQRGEVEGKSVSTAGYEEGRRRTEPIKECKKFLKPETGFYNFQMTETTLTLQLHGANSAE